MYCSEYPLDEQGEIHFDDGVNDATIHTSQVDAEVSTGHKENSEDW